VPFCAVTKDLQRLIYIFVVSTPGYGQFPLASLMIIWAGRQSVCVKIALLPMGNTVVGNELLTGTILHWFYEQKSKQKLHNS